MKGTTSVLLTGLLVAAATAGCGADTTSGAPPASSTATAAGSPPPSSPEASSGPTAAPTSSAPPCVAGAWRSTGVSGRLGGAAGRIAGGTGTTMTVGAGGTTEVGFTGSQPVSFSAQAAGHTIRGQIQYTGSLRAAVRFQPRGAGAGAWQPQDDARQNDLRATVKLSEPFSVTLLDNASIGTLTGKQVPGTGDALDTLPILRGGTYTCSGNTLRVRTEQNGPQLDWTFTRAS
ncbi:hypothetical protein ACIA5C_20605 [Actinoplanes sp. NPDC051343]|uniref:hypothetical protein n=1 Tax=Actinoplanes sp. NPDC051343 TaxID=3363906 RepID=UPI00379C984D